MNNHFFNRYFYLIMLVLSVMLPEGCGAPESKVARNEKGEKDFGQSVSVSDLDSLYSDKVLGCTVEASRTTFRLFAPRATKVQLVIFKTYTDTAGEPVQMTRDGDGVWEHVARKSLTGSFYGYRVSGPEGGQEMFNDQIVIADPYSKAVCTQNTYRHPAKTLILDTNYDWQGDTFVIPENHNDLIIYESHVRDLTMHPSSGIEKKGTYAGLAQSGKTGGLSYLKDLGINAIELLPVHKFGAIELPFKDSLTLGATGLFNTWNPYERNHWGYMTSYFFAPESYYAEGGSLRRNEFSGTDGREVKEMKDMVKALHKEKIAVILDVVYNHVSQYDYNPYKYIDKMYYFHTDGAGNFKGESGCGNDFKTDRLMARRMIVESVKYWMTEYHIDGFRFDLAAMIDWETCKLILEESRKINPNVILIAEPWGGGKYAPDGFSDIGWAAWNDQFRNGVKGQNTTSGHGFIFGKKQGTNSQRTFQSFLTGTLQSDSGLFAVPQHAINYLESHDDNTMSDFIRIATGEAKEGIKVKASNFKLSERQLALNKLAALYLFAAQGPVMIHEGQEFARSKVVAATTAMDTKVGTI
ncbi:MAG: pullulanase, partial [Rhizobacter sp.]|nr:pullulanase [Chlorobiales bacterium]